ncbi:MAG: hypothetical protein WCZ89_09790 [Phycisphaerae bacterium]
MRILYFFIAALLITASGCEKDTHVKGLEQKNLELTRTNRELENQIREVNKKNQQLQKQVETLAKLDSGTRFAGLYELKSVRITRHTNFYDRTKDGIKEKLIVYLQPMDAQGDLIKASGSVDVELWDLSRTDNSALLAKWHVSADELKQMWFATVVTSNYRLMFYIDKIVKSFDRPYTVKVEFTDYVSGKVFIEQYVIQ